jgi:translation initiation factor IF-1
MKETNTEVVIPATIVAVERGACRVALANGMRILAHLSGRMQRNRIQVCVGDTVEVSLTRYDLHRGRIIRRK